MKTIEDSPRSGASVGKYRVFIGWADPDSMSLGDSDPLREPPVKIPQKIRAEGILFTIPSNGTANADFHLTRENH
ncbi:MAG: hypothetical protein LBQ54_12725 [Planctomycetaceae bacterium]|nr:hypothetical protein [Planctomycetaceae bacterium]